jgi:thymidylate synthase (FAD)
MEASLLSITNNAKNIIYLACRQCYTQGSIIDKIDEYTSDPEDKKNELIRRTLSSGHTSVLEHITFTFAIKDISRSCSHQLVRHRIASYSQQSQRFTEASDKDNYIFPKKIDKNNPIVKNALETINDCYSRLINNKIPKEDARFILPNACKTNIVMTINTRSLINFFGERLCTCAQEEIRTLAKKMYEICLEQLPIVFEEIGPKCKQIGYCPESPKRSCGIKPTRDKIFYLNKDGEYIQLWHI